MNIRRAQASDLEAIAKLEAICFPKAEAADLACFKERFSVFGDCFWVLEDEGEIIGFINGMCVNERVIRDELFENASLHCENGAYQYRVLCLSAVLCRRCALARSQAYAHA